MALKITPLLGVVRVLENGALAENSRPANNNTRWMFDVEGVAEGDLVIQLVDMRGYDYKPALGAPSFSAQDDSFYDARPFVLERIGGRITIRQRAEISCKYSVLIDTMHSAMR